MLVFSGVMVGTTHGSTLACMVLLYMKSLLAYKKTLHMPLSDVLHQMHANHEALAVFQVSAFHTVNLPLKGYSTIYTFSQTNMA